MRFWTCLIVIVAGCGDPPCPDYWRVGCELCPGDQEACDAFRAYAEGGLRNEDACRTVSTRMQVLSTRPGAEVLCRMPAGAAPPDPVVLDVPLSCDRVPFQMSLEQVQVGSEHFEMAQITDRFMNVVMQPGEQNTCRYHTRDGDLIVDCAAPLGRLGDDATRCEMRRQRRQR